MWWVHKYAGKRAGPNESRKKYNLSKLKFAAYKRF